MSVSYKIQSILLPSQMNDQEREKYLQERNFKSKFGNAKKPHIDEQGFIHYRQYNPKDNAKKMDVIDLENGAKALVERKKVSYK